MQAAMSMPQGTSLSSPGSCWEASQQISELSPSQPALGFDLGLTLSPGSEPRQNCDPAQYPSPPIPFDDLFDGLPSDPLFSEGDVTGLLHLAEQCTDEPPAKRQCLEETRQGDQGNPDNTITRGIEPSDLPRLYISNNPRITPPCTSAEGDTSSPGRSRFEREPSYDSLFGDSGSPNSHSPPGDHAGSDGIQLPNTNAKAPSETSIALKPCFELGSEKTLSLPPTGPAPRTSLSLPGDGCGLSTHNQAPQITASQPATTSSAIAQANSTSVQPHQGSEDGVTTRAQQYGWFATPQNQHVSPYPAYAHALDHRVRMIQEKTIRELQAECAKLKEAKGIDPKTGKTEVQFLKNEMRTLKRRQNAAEERERAAKKSSEHFQLLHNQLLIRHHQLLASYKALEQNYNHLLGHLRRPCAAPTYPHSVPPQHIHPPVQGYGPAVAHGPGHFPVPMQPVAPYPQPTQQVAFNPPCGAQVPFPYPQAAGPSCPPTHQQPDVPPQPDMRPSSSTSDVTLQPSIPVATQPPTVVDPTPQSEVEEPNRPNPEELRKTFRQKTYGWLGTKNHMQQGYVLSAPAAPQVNRAVKSAAQRSRANRRGSKEISPPATAAELAPQGVPSTATSNQDAQANADMTDGTKDDEAAFWDGFTDELYNPGPEDES